MNTETIRERFEKEWDLITGKKHIKQNPEGTVKRLLLNFIQSEISNAIVKDRAETIGLLSTIRERCDCGDITGTHYSEVGCPAQMKYNQGIIASMEAIKNKPV